MARKHRRSHRRHQRNPIRHRRYHRNFSGFGRGIGGVTNELMYAGLGLIGTRLVVGTVLTTIGTQNQLTTAIAKIATAYGVAWLGGKFIGSGHFNALFLGGAIDGVNDIVKNFIGPMVPGLASREIDFLHGYRPMNGYAPPIQSDIYSS